ncbi:type II toxin-antitoxin system death-on-curing family toxin [Ralstonia insidiosa]|uniref:Type II toxin-antitoxin system death-on-curing family toxin n=1 Tax=Ralstonia insidiosa TaxID=190721 RepID=A0A848NRZ5_9RALS|nr:type II toxin-antitoxin system death-on-curing family toxin [Ralstonia insidiosa]NMV37881.1 type II toxin-antitoxin system death-on-curing family toxin [Ralstonia insidiosa]
MIEHDDIAVGEALAMHSVLIERYGGAAGIRDAGAFESALLRPRTGYYEDLIEEAAALLESVAGNHPCVDGNKRIAFAVTDVFLRINGYRIQGDPMVIHADLMRLFDSGSFDLAHLEPWLRAKVTPA